MSGTLQNRDFYRKMHISGRNLGFFFIFSLDWDVMGDILVAVSEISIPE